MFRRVAVVTVLGLFLIAAHAQGKPAAESKPAVPSDPKTVQDIYNCLAKGLPKGWKQVWVSVRALEDTGKVRRYEAEFRYATKAKDSKGQPLYPCDSRQIANGMLKLSDALPPEQRKWTSAQLRFESDGTFTLHYDYSKQNAHGSSAPSE